MRRLLIRPGAIGDVILSLPEMEAARAEYTEVWAPRAVLPLIRFADRTRAIADTGLDLVGIVEGAWVKELETFDSIYSWYGTNRGEFREAVRGLPVRFFPASWGERQAGLETGRRTGVLPHIAVPKLEQNGCVVIHPFASSVAKRWPMECFREVAAGIGAPVLWCAGPEEELDDAVRFDDLYELACWLATARLYIGNDSGIAHLAAAVGTPVLAIFLVTDPLIWAPRGSHVRVLDRPNAVEVLNAARLNLR